MKKFTMFVIILVVAAFVGVSSYYFAVDSEEIKLNNSFMQVNVGSVFSTDLEIISKNRKTKVTYTIEDSSILQEGSENGTFIAKKGGKTNITIETSNSKFPYFQVQVQVGDGSTAYPYFIFTPEDLTSIGSQDRDWKLSDSYMLSNDLDLSGYTSFTPIGNAENPFTGTFDGNLYTITNLKITDSEKNKNAGLFGVVADNASISFLIIKNPTIIGNFDTIGAIAGINRGNIGKSKVEGGTLTSSNSKSYVGGITGHNLIDVNKPQIEICDSSASISGLGMLGGIAGLNEGGVLYNCNFKGSILKEDTNAAVMVGGITAINSFGEIKIGYESTDDNRFRQGNVKNCLFNGTMNAKTGCSLDGSGYIIGSNLEKDFNKNEITGNYYQKVNLAKENEPAHILSLHAIGNQVETPFINCNALDSQQLIVKENYLTINNVNEYKQKLANNEEVSYDLWNFTGVWIIEENKVPYLNLEGDFTDPKIFEVSSQKINNIIDFYTIMQSIGTDRVKLSLTYYLDADVVLTDDQLWVPVGTKDRPFTGKLIGEYKRYNNVLRYPTITNVKITQNIDYAGLFGCISSNAIINGITLNDVVIESGYYAGSFVAYNDSGLIENCTVNGINIKSGNVIGGICGYNNGNLNNCNVGFTAKGIDPSLNEEEAEKSIAIILNQKFDSCAGGLCGVNSGNIFGGVVGTYILDKFESNDKDANIYVGGIAGKNNGNIHGVNMNQGMIKLKSIKSFVGGIAGENKGLINESKCNFTIECFGSDNETKSSVGGLVGNNYGSIHLSYSKNVLNGYYVGGLVCNNYGDIDQCFARNLFENNVGKYIGGFIYDTISGKVTNSYSYIKISCYDDSSIAAGFSVYLRRDGSFKNCFSNVSFEGAGQKWEETQSMIRRSKTEKVIAVIVKEDADVGVIKNCIFNSTKTDEAKAFYRKGWIVNVSADDTNYLPVNDNLCRGKGQISYSNFKEANFDMKIWNFTLTGEYPTLFNIDQSAQIDELTEI